MYSIFEPAQLGPMMLKNRTVRSATNEHLAQRDGRFTQAWAEAQVELAEGGVGLIITGHVALDPAQRADEGQPAMREDVDLPLLARTCAAVHSRGCRIVMQLSHTGLKAPQNVNGRPPKGPDDFSQEELETLVDQFRRGALMAQRAGFDGVQIHNAHGYLLSSFMNPEQNHRADEYGGTMENRFRLTRTIIEAVRRICGPGFAILAKVDCNSTDDFSGLLKLYQRAGVDGVEVSGLDFAARAGEKSPFYLQQALEAQKELELPLILVGGMFSRAAADQVLQAGIPFVSFSRSLICQPDFINRMEQGEESACLACNGCYKVYRSRPVRCVQHQRPIPQLAKVFGLELD